MKKFLLLLLIMIPLLGYTQTEKRSIGFSYGNGFDYTDQDYLHLNNYFRANYYQTIKTYGKYSHLQYAVEPEINFVRHRDAGERFRQNQIETSVTIGIISRHYLGCDRKWSVYGILGTGPAYLDTDSERQSHGLAMINTVGVGISRPVQDVVLELRPNFRHISNAGFNSPNRGLDTFNIQFTVTVPVTKAKDKPKYQYYYTE